MDIIRELHQLGRDLLLLGRLELLFIKALLERQVTAVGNPAGSFFYVLTALHGLHVLGGLVGWTIAARAVRRVTDAREAAWRIGLTARYWHFLLLVWLALYASFTWITPEVARIICRTP